MSDTDYIVTQKEAADLLKVSTKSISRYRKKGLPYKMMLNPVTGKQEVKFRRMDLERWDEGRQLLAVYGREGEPSIASEERSGRGERPVGEAAPNGFLAELLAVYKEQIELLRDQLEDMREQLARRDRQIDDLMRLMVGLQLEYKPQFSERPPGPSTVEGPLSRESGNREEKKRVNREDLSASVLRLRRKGKSYEDIARGLNHIRVATFTGQPQWTALEVKTLLPPLVDGEDPSFWTGQEF